MTPYEKLHQHFARLNDLYHVGAVAQWDEAAMMPVGGGAARGQALATLDGVTHQMLTDPRIAEWLAAATDETLPPWQAANLREMQRSYRDATCLPESLVERRTLANSRCEQAWRVHRGENNWQAIAPLLEDVVALAREEAAARAAVSGMSLYDSLLDATIEQQQQQPAQPPEGPFTIDEQRALGLAMMRTLGFDFEHGRLDVSHHPFCGGVPSDVRITTRYNTEGFTQALMGVIHETGHALYEQGLPAEWQSQPVGQALSTAVHESQSLLMEMQACRSPEFLHYLTPHLQRSFAAAQPRAAAWQEDNLYRLFTHVKRGYIRVDADEVSYPLHVILRYEIERQLIEGELEVSGIPEAWDARMQSYLGLSTAGNYRDGCLQDVHWPAGLFGYFPTYTLGAMSAAQLFAAARQALPDMPAQLAEGNFCALLGWLREHVHSQGKFLDYNALMQRATGETLQSSYFRAHLEARYLGEN